MANRKLASAVHVAGKWYRPGDVVPDDVAEQITNPHAWATAEDEEGDADTDAAFTEAGTASGARLTTRVSVGGRWYGPHDPIPDDVARLITNPKAWEGGKQPMFEEPPAGEMEMTAGTAEAPPKDPVASDKDTGRAADTDATPERGEPSTNTGAGAASSTATDRPARKAATTPKRG